ncbi:MAG TPA: carboxymuconolactone decarboxylase family protein [Thermoleophilaceae bacterium]|nr:carboxymuconolactone decarboxylase family protein [Thermoleophilaceae bacterium]
MTTAAVPAARIKPLEPPYEPDVEQYLSKLMPPGIEPLKLFRTLAVHFDLASRMRPLGAGLLAHNTIEPRERELVILRTTALNGAGYEWGVHAALFNELTPDEIRATVPGEFHDWSIRDALLIHLCDQLDATATVTDQLWERLREHWSEEQLIELVMLAGWYRTISYVINALQIEPEPWAARLP